VNDAPPNEDAPNVDVFEQLRSAGDAAMPALLRRIDQAVQGGGTVTKRVRCGGCGEPVTVDVEVADTEEIRKLVEMFANLRLRVAQAQKGDDASVGATRLLRDRSELTDAELAEYIDRLRNELAPD
jgi:hypothetical protein